MDPASHPIHPPSLVSEDAVARGGPRWSGLRRIPRRTRRVALLILVCAAFPPATLAGAGWSPVAAWLAAHPVLVNLAAFAAALATVIVWERPRSASPRAFAHQLRARVAEIQSQVDAEPRRRPGEGKEKEHDDAPFDP